MVKICELDVKKLCDNCMDCEVCDLVPDKVCDNCGNCIESEDGFNTVKIDEFVKEQEEKDHKLRITKANILRQKQH